jgi:hypothetical protein
MAAAAALDVQHMQIVADKTRCSRLQLLAANAAALLTCGLLLLLLLLLRLLLISCAAIIRRTIQLHSNNKPQRHVRQSKLEMRCIQRAPL